MRGQALHADGKRRADRDDDGLLDNVAGADVVDSGDDDDAGGDETGTPQKSSDDLRRLSAATAQLRSDARELKQCFTRYAFSAIGLCCLMFAGIFRYIPNEPIVGVGALSVLPIIFAISRLGIYKFQRSNRAFGYELYLERTRRTPPEYCGRWKMPYRELLSWEEAMDAWRAVEPNLYRAIYSKPHFGPPRIKPGLKRKCHGPMWFLPENEMATAGVRWRPGHYLGNIMLCLAIIAVIAIAMISISAWQFAELTPNEKSPDWLLRPSVVLVGILPGHVTIAVGALVCLGAAILATIATHTVMRRAFAASRKIRMELMSVHSCAVIWLASVVAHFTAVEKSRQYKLSCAQLQDALRSAKTHDAKKHELKKKIAVGDAEEFIARELQRAPREPEPDGFGLPGYAFWLGQEAASLAAHPLEIHRWIFDRCAHQ
jgi:hypothetical protein